MRETKFTMNALILVVIIFSGIFFFFTVRITGMADLAAYNQFYPVEGTNVAVRFSNLYPNGIYEGDQTNGKLKIKGIFGSEWGAVAEGDQLYINEYITTDFNWMLCHLVRVDLNTYEKTVLRRDTMLRGRCASGELVCVDGFTMPNNFPKTNAMFRLYAMTTKTMEPKGDGAQVLFLDPATGEVVYSVWDDHALTEDIESRYLAYTLEEVRG